MLEDAAPLSFGEGLGVRPCRGEAALKGPGFAVCQTNIFRGGEFVEFFDKTEIADDAFYFVDILGEDPVLLGKAYKPPDIVMGELEQFAAFIWPAKFDSLRGT